MMSDVVQAQYEGLESISQRFARQAAATEQLHARMARMAEQLAQQGWKGQGATAFHNEMQGTIFPALQRLGAALEQSAKTTKQIEVTLRQAEEEAAGLFQGQVGAGASILAGLGLLGGVGAGIALGGLMAGLGLSPAASALAGILKGVEANHHLNRYRFIVPDGSRGSSAVAILMDMMQNKGRGMDRFRWDAGDRGTPHPHLNANPKLTGVPDPHTPISARHLRAMGMGARLLSGAQRIAVPVAIGLDVFRVGSALHTDGWRVGEESKQAIGGVAGGWGGAAVGVKIGASVGAFGGPVGIAIGGVAGGIIGGIGGGWIGETIGDWL